jgi:hypothetical protein
MAVYCGGKIGNEIGFYPKTSVCTVNFHFIYGRVQLKCDDTREGKWGGNWRMEWIATTLHTTSEHGVSSITTADAHTSAASSRLTDAPADLNVLVCFAERRNLVSARVPSQFYWPLPIHTWVIRGMCSLRGTDQRRHGVHSSHHQGRRCSPLRMRDKASN